MSNNKTSAFLAILKTYAPNYEPRQTQKENEQKKTTKKPAPTKQEPPPEEETEPLQPTKPVAKKKLNRKRVEDDSDNREATSEFTKPDEEKCLKSYENWQMVKQELKEEDTDRLKQKIYLQLQLIRAQEIAYQQKIQEQEEEKAKKREEEKAVKRAQTEALLEQCKQSLAEDRKQAALKKRKNRTKSTSTNVTLGGVTAVTTDGRRSEGKTSKTPHEDLERLYAHQRMPTQALLDDSEDEKEYGNNAVAPNAYDKHRREGTDVSSVASLTPTPGKMSPVTREITTNITREMTRASTLPEEDEDDEEEGEEEIDEFAEFPPYQRQLYRLYGRKNADYFLHPKVEAEAKKQTKKLDPKFKNPDGRTGANELWTNLRKESHGKLLRTDATIPEELKAQIAEYRKRYLKNKKSAFSCFARESVSKLRKPIRRSYYVKDDVPELDRLLDQSIVQDAQNYRHKMELMYRSSQKNEDRFKVLTFNNPVPNLNNMTGEESVARYMPSWIDNDDDEESEKSYTKWIGPGNSARLGSRTQSLAGEMKEDAILGKQEKDAQDNNSDILPNEWDFMMVKKQSREALKGPKYVFLTERDTTTPGQFRKRRQEALAAKTYPAAYQPKDGSQSAMATFAGPGPSTQRSGRSAFAVSTEFTLSGPGEPRSQSTNFRDMPTWEPLSMNALVEYKQNRGTLGSGDFAQGKAPTWHVGTTAAVN